MHPDLAQFGPLRIHSYGLMLVLAFLAAVWWASRTARREGLTAQQVMDAGLAILLSGVVFARLVFVLLEHQQYSGWVDVFYIWEGGLSLHGGLFGAMVGGAWYCRSQGIPFLKLADVASPGAALGYAIGRVGCLLNGCCYGSACSLPWAMRFPDLASPGGLTPPSHPTQIYSSLAGLLMFGLLAWLARHRSFRGQVFGAFLVLYSIYRFIVEFYRKGATARVLAAGLTEAQVASLAMFVAALALLYWWRGRETAAKGAAAAA